MEQDTVCFASFYSVKITTNLHRTDKEHFEPLLQDLLALLNRAGRFSVCEAWAFDRQSHGDSAILNDAALRTSTDPSKVAGMYSTDHSTYTWQN
jgi:hypothetical protein